ncbi:MAG: HigA family addiction module antitoxin [Clostridiales bacterium]|nr:HigA family addiction module antitoxin [Clostridiales bacterium]
MKGKKNGLSADLIIHPGETLFELLENRKMKQNELACRTGFSEKHISEVVNGKADISSKLAVSLENVFDVSAKFWLNLQSNYDIELLEHTASDTVSVEELNILDQLNEVLIYLKSVGILPKTFSKEADVLKMRKFLAVSSLTSIPSLQLNTAFRTSPANNVNPYVLFAWIRLCEMKTYCIESANMLDVEKLKHCIPLVKKAMFLEQRCINDALSKIFSDCGIKFSIVKHFNGAPVQGFIEKAASNTIILCLTIRLAWADVFWFTLLHEIGHILNQDIGTRFVDYSVTKTEAESLADKFAQDALLCPDAYSEFIKTGNYSLDAIKEHAKKENVPPYIVIGRMQKENYLTCQDYPQEKVKYNWEV